MSKLCKAIIAVLSFCICISGKSYAQDASEDLVDVFKLKRQPLPAYWQDTPDIRLCTGSGVTVQRLNRALDFWKRLGYQFGRVIVDNDSYTCVTGGVEGEITVLLFTQDIIDGEHLAVTRTRRNTSTNQIIQIQIYINRYGAQKLLVLEHEIGHALGWSHRRERYHLMNENWNDIGHVTTGLSFREYQSEILKLKQSNQ